MIIRKIKTVFTTPLYRWGLLIRVLGLSIEAWYLDRFNPKIMRPEKILNDGGLSEPKSEPEIQRIRDIAWVIRKVSRVTPWENVCRHQAWQAAKLLHESGLKFQYVVGAKKNATGIVDGHSWVISANRFVSGRCKVSEYKIINKYG